MDCESVRDDLLDVLYDEADGAARRRAEEHLTGCASCRDELEELRLVRRRLAGWTLPRTRKTRALGRAPWVLAAAALLLAVGGGLRLARAEFRFESGPILFAVGGGPREALEAQEQRHRRELAELRDELRGQREAVLLRVQELLREGEARQAQALQASLGDLAERAEAQRRFDLARVSAGLSYLEGKTGQHVARTTELMNYVLAASERR